MSALRFVRKKSTPKRSSSLAIIAFPHEAAAFHAYRLLQQHGISPENLAIVGQGYSSPDSVGLLEPMAIALHSGRSLSGATGLVGTFLGFVLFWVAYLGLKMPLSATLFLIVPAGGFIGGFIGATLGGLWGFFGKGSTAGIYRHQLRKGHYLLMIEGSEKLVRSARDIISVYSAHQTR